jgi:hypothetical protein
MSLNQISYFIPNYPNLSVSGAISSASAQITTLTASNIAITNNLSVAGTLTTVNLTTTNLIDTNITAGSANITNATIATARITSNLLALGNSNTLGNLFTTGGNVLIGATSNTVGASLLIGGQTGVYPISILLQPSTSSTGSKRTAIQIDNWQLLSDVSGNGIKDFGIFDNGANAFRFIISTSGNLGIGTQAPVSLLDLYTANNRGGIYSTLSLRGSGGAGNSSTVDFWPFTRPGGAGARIGGMDDGDYSSHLYFSTAQSGSDSTTLTERMRITSTGAIMMGRTSTTNNWDSFESCLAVSSTEGSSRAVILLGNSSNTGTNYHVVNEVSGLTFYRGSYGNGTTIMQLCTNGNVGIGNQSPNQTLVIGSTAAFFTASGSGDQFVVHANASSNASGYFYYNSINNYGTISDTRIKSDITPINTQDALAFISNITPSDFVLNGQTERQSGFIAQNVLAAVQNDAQKSAIAKWETYDETDPECPFMGISDRPILSNLVAVVKSQQTEIDTLKAFIQSKFPGEF